ncbi:MAG: hypothetical protein NZL90_05340, partial [Aquificaceae bacterium]|nr:hypothetical protein [Aquificaceae bacterium]
VAHAILSDKDVHPKEIELFKSIVKVMGVEKELPEDYYQLQPLESLVGKLDTKVKQLEALSLCIKREGGRGRIIFSKKVLFTVRSQRKCFKVEIAKSLAKVRKDFWKKNT